MSIIAALVFIGLLILTVPVAHALLIASGAAMAAEEPLFLFEAILKLYNPTSQFPMLAIPFFILAGDLMMSGRFGEYLMNFTRMLVGWMKGGLSQVSVLGSLFFGGVSGSAVADASALGNALIPVQKGEGYPDGYSAAVNSASSTISVLIPPSIPLILYGLVTEASIPDLFLAGIVPGVMLTVVMFVLCYIIGRVLDLPRSRGMRLKRDDFGVPRDWLVCAAIALVWAALHRVGALGFAGKFALPLAVVAWFVTGWCYARFLSRFNEDLVMAVPALVMPLMVIVLARGGVVTPTEISVIAVFYALLVGFLVYRDLTLSIVVRCVLTAGMMTGVIMLVIMGSSVLQWILSYESVPQNLANWMLQVLESPWTIILAMNLLMIVIGTFLDLPAAVLLLAPIFLGVASAVGLEPVQLGVIMVVNLAIGLYTPPVGTTLFVSVAIEKVPMGRVVVRLAPFYAAALIVLALVSFVPQITTVFL